MKRKCVCICSSFKTFMEKNERLFYDVSNYIGAVPSHYAERGHPGPISYGGVSDRDYISMGENKFNIRILD